MRSLIFGFAAMGVVAVSAPALAQTKGMSQTPDNIQELFQFLYQCARVPPGGEGSELTLRFSLTHYGALRGKPMITYSKLAGSPEDQRVFVSTALDALEKCMPVPVTEHFGKIVAQKIIVMRFPRPREIRSLKSSCDGLTGHGTRKPRKRSGVRWREKCTNAKKTLPAKPSVNSQSKNAK
jgi:hypothetical protein